MNGQQILIPVDATEFWQQMRNVIFDVLIENGVIRSQDCNTASPRLLKTKEVCELFQVSKPTVYDWMENGMLKSVKIESRRFFLASDVEELIAKSKHSTT